MKPGFAHSPFSSSLVLYCLAGLIFAAVVWGYCTPIDISVRARGIVRPEGDPVRIISEAGGRIRTINIVEGSRVRLGDPLLQLETADLELKKQSLEARIHFTEVRLADLQRQVEDETAIESESGDVDEFDRNTARRNASSALENAQLRFTRAQVLFEQGLIPRQTYEDARAALTQAEVEESRFYGKSLELKRTQGQAHLRSLSGASTPLRSELSQLYHELQQCRLDINRLTITSPMAGQVTSLASLHPGEIISAGAAIGTIAPEDRSPLVEAWVPTSDRSFISPGQHVRLQADAFPADQHDAIDGAVLYISPDARFNESLSGAFRVLVMPAADSSELKMGMTFEVRFITHQERLLWLLFQKIKRHF